eukprot:jgi/Mesvir1/20290/Mv19896-RA.3
MKQDDGVTRVPDPGVCAFWIKKKKSFCRWPPLNGGKYCRHHVEGRVPCPINPNHFIPADEVDQHVLRCPSITQQRESQEQPHFCKGVNRPRKGAPPAITAAAAAVAAATAPATITNGGDRGAGAGREARAGSQADTTAPRDTGRAPSSAITDVTSGQQGEAPRAACGQLASDRGPDSRPGKRCIAAAANNNDNRGTGAAANALGAGAAPDDARKHKAAIRQLATSLSQEQLSALLDKVGQACRMLRCDEERHPLRCSVLRPAVAEEVMLSEGGSDEPHKFALSRRHTIQQASILGNLLEFGIVRGASITHGSDANPPAGAVQEPGRCDGNAVDDQIAHVEKNGQQAVHATVGSGHQTPPMTLAAHHGEGTGASHADIGGGRDAMNDVMYIQDAPVIATGSPRSQSGDAACPQPQHLSRDAACPQPQHLPRDAACPQPQHLPLKGGSACPSRPRAEGKGREQQDGWVPPPPVLVEFGAGKGYLSLCLSMCLGLRDVVLVDRGTFRNKAPYLSLCMMQPYATLCIMQPYVTRCIVPPMHPCIVRVPIRRCLLPPVTRRMALHLCMPPPAHQSRPRAHPSLPAATCAPLKLSTCPCCAACWRPPPCMRRRRIVFCAPRRPTPCGCASTSRTLSWRASP